MTDETSLPIYSRADIYHDFYSGRGKDYRGEAELVRDLVRQRAPHAASLLDVACGSGAHLRELAPFFTVTEGVDLAREMVELAGRNNQDLAVHHGNMRDFRLERRFDAVLCMFSSVGYLATPAELDQALRTFAEHVTDGGVVLVEPWWFPDTFIPGWVGADLVTVRGRSIARVSHSVRGTNASHMTVHYTVASPAEGVEHFTDTHVMTLFERETYESAFARAGLDVEYVKHDMFAPGVFVGTKKPAGTTP